MQIPLTSSAPRGAAAAAAAAAGTCPRLRHILTGTFNTLFLHLLTFDTLTRDLTVTLSVPARGPHQYLTLGGFIPEIAAGSGSSSSSSGSGSGSIAGGSALQASRIVYATTWADQRELSAWRVSLHPGQEKVSLINAREILAAGSYVAVQPPPYESLTSPAYGVRSSLKGATSSSGSASSSNSSASGGPARFLYQAGGPTGEVFELDAVTGAIGTQTQQLVFLPGGEEALAGADKSRKSLRYGAHNVDFDVNGLAYVADL
jgi:carboxy-cis,cis-muconate cyclase